MGDDGIGLRIVEHIDGHGLAHGFEVKDLGSDAMKLLSYFDPGTERILVVDCVKMGLPPGEYRLFGPREVATRKIVPGLSTHEGDLLKVIELASSVGYVVPDIAILGIEPASMDPVMELSETLKARFGEYVDAVLSEMRD